MGGGITGAAEALRAVAAGVQTLTDMWGERLNSQTGDGPATDNVWTVGEIVLFVCERAQALEA